MFYLNFFFFFLIYFIELLFITLYQKKIFYKWVYNLLILNNIFIFIIFCLFFNSILINNEVNFYSINLNINIYDNIMFKLDFKLDFFSYLFCFLVVIIGLSTNIYSLNYIKFEENSKEFILLLNWFIISMLILCLSNNLLSLMLGWELIGLSSFLLINFWKFKKTTLTFSFKAFTFNKVSDVFLMLGTALIFNFSNTSNFSVFLSLISYSFFYKKYILVLICFCFLLCSSIKSAQLLGHLWLPDSMEAPVPASALIHSATLVSAGIFLLLKFNSLYIYCDLLIYLISLGSLTACYGGVVASSQTDMKKLLAYSTISHCGFIICVIGFNNFFLSMIYLYLHGIYKALTFFCVGSFIKSNNTQDMRFMGSNKNQYFNIICLIIASSNLCGLPFTFGYVYKDLFLNILILKPIIIFYFGFLIIGLLSSIVYYFKLIYYSGFDFRKGFLQITYLFLQNNTKFNIKYHFTTNFAKVLSFYFLFFISFLIFIIIKFFFIKHIYLYNHFNEIISLNYKHYNNILFNKYYIIHLFYIYFVFIIFSLFLFNFRNNYFYIEKLLFLVNIFFFFIFFFIINNYLFIT